MLNWIKRQLGIVRTNNWRPVYQPTEGFQSLVPRSAGAIIGPDQALTLSPVWAALRLYQTQIASLPLVTYKVDDQGGRTEAELHPAFKLLKYQPNPAQTRATFWEKIVHDYFMHGEAFIHVRWRGNGNVVGLYPIPAGDVSQVLIDEEWNKTYLVRDHSNEVTTLDSADVVHLIHTPDKYGIRGVSLLRYAAENLGLHRSILDAGTSFYQNAARPSGYLKYQGKLTPDAIENIKKNFKDAYQGSENTGTIPILTDGEFVQFVTKTAEDAAILDALSNVTDVARWFQLSPLVLGDLTRGTYSNLAADNVALYQKSVRPVLDKFELGINNCLFGAGASTLAEFDVDEILRGDPQQMAQVSQTYVQMGAVMRSEVRSWLNLSPIEGLDTPLAPVNQGVVPPAPNAPMTPVDTNKEGGTSGDNPQSTQLAV